MDHDSEISTDSTGPARATRPGAMHRISNSHGAFRAPREQAEIKRRIVKYAAQVKRRGFITWIPRQENLD